MQELFTRAVLGVIAQGKPSMTDVSCAYRGPNGTKCAVGFLIEDDFLPPDLNEDAGLADNEEIWEAILVSNPDLAPQLGPEARRMLEKLQNAHDNAALDTPFVASFIHRARKLADEYNLEMPHADA